MYGYLCFYGDIGTYIYMYIYICRGLGFRSITEYEMEDQIELGIIPWFIKIWGSNVHCVYIYICVCVCCVAKILVLFWVL